MQISFFDGSKPFKIDKPIRLIELFTGIGSQAKALKNSGVNFEHYRICEFDKYAVQSYNAVHGTNFKTSDITKIKAEDLGITGTNKYCYIMTYSFPCQDLSNAGKQAGMAKGSGTRSGLLWEVERLLDGCEELPQVLLMENVPAVIGSANIEHFAKWIEKLEKLGYKNKWQILNAKDFGVPQNRERCFMVSILGDYYYEFPSKTPLKLRLKDMLEVKVDKKYYLSDRLINFFVKNTKEQKEKGNGFKFQATDGNCVVKTISTKAGARMDDNFIIYDDYNGRIKADQSCIGTLTCNCGNEAERNGIKIIEPQYSDYSLQKISKNIVKGDTVGTITANAMQSFNHDNCHLVATNYRIRKLTPKECWRLMGFEDKDIEKAIAIGMSDTQLYRQAGNSIVVNVLMAIFKKMI